jgi:hypothetical protein
MFDNMEGLIEVLRAYMIWICLSILIQREAALHQPVLPCTSALGFFQQMLKMCFRALSIDVIVLSTQGFPTPTDQRHCVNSRSIKFQNKE